MKFKTENLRIINPSWQVFGDVGAMGGQGDGGTRRQGDREMGRWGDGGTGRNF
ncbi:hypothetical protein H6G81_02810 [Scytonema hofmannii FACHB-248]|uniref:Uncharacterized protein n=1 Tax=Scytonema hofmannii FACHB-248 TaxID=1842502 RepID=A0ABR8GJT4_9CYAN|nr:MULTISPECIES: hypothetical protein [Nostocales]MBD2603486.1 hypothetical protein [Scytonema hofmannii FACHB-248]